MIDPRHVKQYDYPDNGSFKEQALFLINYAVLAPSSHNTQPWLFNIHDDHISLFADTSRALPITDAYNRELMISCGAALGNLEVAANFFGLTCSYTFFPNERDGNHLVDIALSNDHKITADDRRLFSAIKDRATTRSDLLPLVLPSSVNTYLDKKANSAGVEITLISDSEQRNYIAELISKADNLHFSDPEFREELTQWMRASNSQKFDGVTTSDHWTPNILAKIESMIIKRFDVGESVAAKDRTLTEHSPLLLVLSTTAEEPLHWLATGKFLSELLLYLTAIGISVGYLNQAVEILEIRKSLREQSGISGYPQLLLRLGKSDGHTVTPSKRRPLMDVVTILP